MGMGLFAVYHLRSMTIKPDIGEDFPHQLNALLPDCLFGDEEMIWLRARPRIDKPCAYAVFGVGASVTLCWTIAVVVGLFPNLKFLMGAESATRTTLVQAELWGACGFIFMGFHVQQLISFVYSTWDDLESLKTLATHDKWPGSNEPLI